MFLKCFVDLCKTRQAFYFVTGNPNIRLVPGCQAFVKFCRHTPLQSIVHLIPEHVIVACDKKIPGVSEENSVVGQGTLLFCCIVLICDIICIKFCFSDRLLLEA